MLPAGILNKTSGFTLVVVLAMVVVVGIVASTAITTNSFKAKRDREEELLFRGTEIKNAIASYYLAGKPKKVFPQSFEQLVKDTRYPNNKRYLRKEYLDPITNTDFQTIPSMDGGFSGVYSSSNDIPLKQANFPVELVKFEGATQYSDWQFEYIPPKKKSGAIPKAESK